MVRSESISIRIEVESEERDEIDEADERGHHLPLLPFLFDELFPDNSRAILKLSPPPKPTFELSSLPPLRNHGNRSSFLLPPSRLLLLQRTPLLHRPPRAKNPLLLPSPPPLPTSSYTGRASKEVKSSELPSKFLREMGQQEEDGRWTASELSWPQLKREVVGTGW